MLIEIPLGGRYAKRVTECRLRRESYCDGCKERFEVEFPRLRETVDLVELQLMWLVYGFQGHSDQSRFRLSRNVHRKHVEECSIRLKCN